MASSRDGKEPGLCSRNLIAGWRIPEIFKATKIRDACAKLPVASGKPRPFVAGLFYPPLLWSVGRNQGEAFTADPNDGAGNLQRQDFLQPGHHQTSKYHGKLRTKFDRVV